MGTLARSLDANSSSSFHHQMSHTYTGTNRDQTKHSVADDTP
jgi:hypothetical protein